MMWMVVMLSSLQLAVGISNETSVSDTFGNEVDYSWCILIVPPLFFVLFFEGKTVATNKAVEAPDPRQQFANFFSSGDDRGPAGSLKIHDLQPDPTRGQTEWFAVYRPTNVDAIAKMRSGEAVGKGLNVKGKSARKGRFPGCVPFIQISDGKHKSMIEKSPSHSRLKLYFKSEQSRKTSIWELKKILLESRETLEIDNETITNVDEYKPNFWGIDLPEPLLQEAWIKRPNLSPVPGWETGRKSEPAFMNMNLQAIRSISYPKVVLLQYDENNPMNPHGLLVAYAEKLVKPVVSDFDTFTIGSKGMDYLPLPDEQAEMITWALKHTLAILDNLDHNPWTSRWLDVLKFDDCRLDVPEYGFGDPTSCQIIGDLVTETLSCGAVRHGAECCNFHFPQEMDDEFLVVWKGFPDGPWRYLSEKELRQFLMDRIKEGFIAPLNPVWPVRDKGWYDVFAALKESPHAEKALACWYPPKAKILESIEEIHSRFPQGFHTVSGSTYG